MNNLRARNGRAFSAMSVPAATRLAAGLVRASELGVTGGLQLIGSWRNRRFVVSAMQPVYGHLTAAPLEDLESLSLTLPLGADASTIARETRRFGARVERLVRDQCNHFEVVPSLGDTESHVVHAYHHVALCGHRGPWPEASEAGGTDRERCQLCHDISATAPNHRARYHPAMSANNLLTPGLPTESPDWEQRRVLRPAP